MVGEIVAERPIALDLVGVPAFFALLGEVPAGREVDDDVVGTPFADADAGGDLAEPKE